MTNWRKVSTVIFRITVPLVYLIEDVEGFNDVRAIRF